MPTSFPEQIKFHNKGTAFEFTIGDNISIVLSKFRQSKFNGVLSANVMVKSIAQNKVIHFQQLSPFNTRSRQELAGGLSNKYREIKWQSIVDHVCLMTIEQYSLGSEPREILGEPDSKIAKPKFLLEPLSYRGEPTLIFGDGKTSKSYLALAICILITLRLTNNPLGFRPELSRCLYLDYERSERVFETRLNLLLKGLGQTNAPILYRRCIETFADDIENIQNMVTDNNIGFLVIDSIGAACAGDINSSEVATRFAQALHKLNVASLLITHVSKGEYGHKTPIGSVYFRNLATNVFEIRKQQEVGEDAMDIILINDDNNLGKKTKTLGFHLCFKDDRTEITQKNVGDIPAFAGEVPQHEQMRDIMHNKPLSVKEIASEIGTSESSVRALLSRHKDKFTKFGDLWGLATTINPG